MVCIGNCYPPSSTFPFWDVVTGSAPVNEYTILGYQMIVLAYALSLLLIPMIIVLFFLLRDIIRDIQQRRYDQNGNRVE